MRYHSLVVGAVPAALRVTAWTPDRVVMGLEHRTRRVWGVQFHPESICTEHGRALLRNFRDLTHARRRSPVPAAATRAAGPATGVRLHHRTLERWCDPEAAFVALYGDHEHAVWLDSSRAEPGLARFSFMGAPDGPLGQVVRYDVATRTLTIERAGRTEQSREHVFDYCERELARLRADAPELPFDFTCGFAGYFGYELKADLGGALVHRSPLPDAALVFCDRLIAFDHDGAACTCSRSPRPTAERRRRMAGDDRARARRARTRRRRSAAGAARPVVHRARGSRRLPGQHRRLHAARSSRARPTRSA